MEIVNLKLEEIKPYENNPRFNEKAVEKVANSIQEFGFKVPIIVDSNYTIVAGHTRYKASLKLGYTSVPCIVANDLSEKQIKAFRIAENRVSEEAKWDYDLLSEELSDLDDFFTGFDLEELNIDWAKVEELTEENYVEPPKEMLQCPQCHHIDSKTHFKKIIENDITEIKEEKIEEKIKLDYYEVRLAELDDIDKIKKIADKYAKEIGFVLKPALIENIKKGSVIVAIDGSEVLGFVNYNRRKRDDVSVIYEIAVDKKYRGNGIGRKMIDFVPMPIQLKCPIDNESNNFYKANGFSHIGIEEGKKRQLNLWELKSEDIS